MASSSISIALNLYIYYGNNFGIWKVDLHSIYTGKHGIRPLFLVHYTKAVSLPGASWKCVPNTGKEKDGIQEWSCITGNK